MSKKYYELEEYPRILIESQLKPVQGDRFQPASFSNLGNSVYERPDGKEMVLVDTAQSVANMLESAIIGDDGVNVEKELDGISYVVSELELNHKDGRPSLKTRTSSLIEPHRINSPYIMFDHPEFQSKLVERADYSKGTLINWKKMGETLFYFDINSLLHGTFLSNLKDGGRFRVPRIMSGFIEAENVKRVLSGGVKNSSLNDPSGEIVVEGHEKDKVYTSVPYTRTEFTAESISAYFNIDLSLIYGYGMNRVASNLLISLALYKIVTLLKNGLRPRTACDLIVKKTTVTYPEAFELPSQKELLEEVKKNIMECRKQGLFPDPPVTVVKTKVQVKEKVKEKSSDDEKE
jgi:CRISPR-associated protein Csb1